MKQAEKASNRVATEQNLDHFCLKSLQVDHGALKDSLNLRVETIGRGVRHSN